MKNVNNTYTFGQGEIKGSRFNLLPETTKNTHAYPGIDFKQWFEKMGSQEMQDSDLRRSKNMR